MVLVLKLLSQVFIKLVRLVLQTTQTMNLLKSKNQLVFTIVLLVQWHLMKCLLVTLLNIQWPFGQVIKTA